MRYTVTWLPVALQELTRIWTHASNRNAVTRATNHIDRQLKYVPGIVGHVHGTGRRFTAGPLTVVYDISPDDCLVRVTEVWYT